MRPFLLTCSLAGALASTACAQVGPPPALQATVPASLTAPCPRPDRSQVRTVGDLASFSIEQEAAIGVCQAQRDQAVQIVQDLNAANSAESRALAPRPWWRLW